MSKEIIGLAKFGEKKYMEELLKGTLFLNTVNSFKKIENDYRGDVNEGLSDLIQPEYAALQFQLPASLGGDFIHLDKDHGLAGAIKIHDIDYTNTNIYSLYMIYPDESFSVDDKVLQFGESMVFIYNPKEFLDRVTNKLKELSLSFKCGPVHYLDEKSYQGQMSIFDKFSKYNYQNEYRIHVINKEDAPLFLNIGNISDIAKILPSDIMKYISIKNY